MEGWDGDKDGQRGMRGWDWGGSNVGWKMRDGRGEM